MIEHFAPDGAKTLINLMGYKHLAPNGAKKLFSFILCCRIARQSSTITTPDAMSGGR